MARKLSDLIDGNPPVRAGDADYETLFKDLQCNILTPHLHRRAYYWLVQFRAGADQAVVTKYLLGQLSRSHFGRIAVRTALDNDATRAAMSQDLQRIAKLLGADAPAGVNLDLLNSIRDVAVLSEYDYYWKRKSVPDEQAVAAQALTPADQEGGASHPIHVNVLLSHSGYNKLGLANALKNDAFVQGMAARGQRGTLHDPPPRQWDKDYHEADKAKQFDALLIVGCDPSRQLAQVDALRKIVREHSAGFHEEVGDIIRAKGGKGARSGPYSVEPFGYKDGISQPVFYEAELQQIGRESSWNPAAPLSLALCADPLGRTPFACGSYFVYRKLQQDIPKFYAQSDELARQRGDEPERLRAGLVGRQRDGTPLTPVARADDNDFDFDDDQRGATCPFHAHIRKSNPRRDIRPTYNPMKRRIVRRAIPYGPAIPRDEATGAPLAPQDAPADVGLLFLCAQADIESQFEHIQGAWENNPNHPPAKLAGVDAVSGQSSSQIRIPSAVANVLPNTKYEQVVNLKGGEYFFAPSISFLRGLLDDLLT